MKRSFLMLFIILLISSAGQQVAAQYNFTEDLYYDHPVTYELGASIGSMNCLTDLGGKKGIGRKYFHDLNFGKSQIAGSVYFSAIWKYAIGLKAEATFGKIKADDNTLESVKETTYGRYERNLHFKSNVIEIMLALEVHPRYLLKRYQEGEPLPRISPYVTGGIGYFSFNPQAMLNGEWIDLQPLSTEGEGFKEYPDRKPYKLKQFNFPVGIGVKYKVSPLINVSLECVSRILHTDYLDDVSTTYIDPTLFPNYLSGAQLSNAIQLNDRQGELNPAHGPTIGWQRGNPSNNDSYFTVNLKMCLIF